MLLSGAMLAACTADDDFKAPVAQEMNSSAPVFNVRFDGDDLQNRATYDDEKGMKVLFDDTDLLSLYNGFEKQSGAVSLAGTYQNAIYRGGSEGSEGFTFKTNSMVNEGNAILIYPADTTFLVNKGKDGLYIEIETDQDADYKKKTPYMSEVLEIGAWDGVSDSTAGYGKKYDIVLKRAASTLALNLDLAKKQELPADVKPFTVKKVTMAETNTNNKPFTKKIKVIASNDAPVAYVADKAHKTWAKQSEFDLQTAGVGEGVSSISTTDVKDNVATFTLLPTIKSAGMNTNTFQVEVQTNYGKVTLSNDANKKVFEKNKEKENTLFNGFVTLLTTDLWKKQTSKTSVFYKDETDAENVGFYLPRSLEVDMTDLDMNNLHIEDEAHLIDVLKVYDKIKAQLKNPKVTFVLDGELEGDNKTKFVMHKDAWEAVVKQLESNDDDYSVTFTVCSDEAECKAIVLDNETNDPAEIPELNITNGATLELVKGWIFTGPAKDPEVSGNKTKAKALKGFSTIIVTKDGTLELKGYINVDETNLVTIENQGVVSVNEDVYLQENMVNNKTINISSNGDLSVQKANVSLTNNEADIDKDANKKNGWNEGAVINVEGTLSAVKNSQAEINNFGVINQKTAKAVIMITRNEYTTSSSSAVTGSKIATQFGSVNKFGTINLVENRTEASDERVTVFEDNGQGFIKVTLNKNNPQKSDIGSVANYIVLDGADCKELTFGSITVNYVTTTYVPTTVKYVEVKKTAENEDVTFRLAGGVVTNAPTLKGLFVKKGCTVYIPGTVTITLDNTDSAVFAEGKINCPGTLTNYAKTKLNNYFGNNTNAQQDNVKSDN